MRSAAVPANEPARLDALRRYQILDTEREQAFDDLTALAASLCDAPGAFISFVDEHRQWFKSTYGVDACETPRDVAFCAHAILEPDGLFEVSNATADPRFHGNPLVTDSPGIRAYAGAVLESPDHHRLGTICVFDRQPRAFSRPQVDALRRLARQVVAHLTLRQTARMLADELARKEFAERELMHSEQRYRELVDNALGLICAHGLDGTLIMVNQGAVTLLGYERDELVGRNLREFIPAEYREAFDLYLDQVRAGAQFSGLLTLCRRDGRRVAMAFQNFTFESSDGSYVIGHGIDITDRVKAEAMNRKFAIELEAARQEALQASRLKSEFVANMSHEIRTPINGVLGLTTLLLETTLAADQRQYAEGVQQSAESLITIINDVLDLSKIEAGKLTIEPVPFEVRPILARALEPVLVKANCKRLSVEVHCDAAVPDWVVGDPVRLRQIIVNLADNAVKFTSRGSVRVEVTRQANLPSGFRFTVQDTGIGIPKDKLSAIFEKFTQADNSTTRQFGGSGLGLTISRQLVALMGGTITVDSEVGRGSTFVLSLPLEEAAPPPVAEESLASASASAPERRTLHVLLVEDNAINQTVARRHLEKAGCTVDVVDNGEAAVRAIEDAAASSYDAIFMDCQMPGMDGYEATRRIRQMDGRGGLPIIALTAHAMRGDRERCFDAGMTDYIAKPIRPESVRAALDQVRLAAPSPAPEPAAPACAADFDAEEIWQVFEGDVEGIVELVRLVTTDVPRYVKTLIGHMSDSDWNAVARMSHTIRGAVGNVTATRVADLAGEIERAARAADGGRVRALCPALEEMTAALVEALREWSNAVRQKAS
jgi:PAS domain S-box-containing protein